MSNPELTFEALEAEVRKIAAERPDFVYDAQPERVAHLEAHEFPAHCSYVGALVPGPGIEYTGEACIMGQALTRLGVSRYDLVRVEGNGVVDAVFGIAGDIEILPGQSIWLRSVQANQDSGYSWADAVAKADARALEDN